MRSILFVSIFLGIFGGTHTVFAADVGELCDQNNQCSTLFCLGGDNNLGTGDAQGNSGVCKILPPTGLIPSCGSEGVLFAGLTLDWDDVVGFDHYELYYKLETAADWNDKYPSVSQFSLPGLLPNRPYQWYVVSCGNEDCSESATSSVCTFKTKEAGPPPPGGGSGGGDGGGGSDESVGGGSGKIENPISAQNITELFNKIFSFLFGLAIFIVPVIVIYAAFLMLMGGGDPVKLQKGRMILLWTAIAFIIILLSRGLPVVFKNLL